jgi:putative two-component system response regulator
MLPDPKLVEQSRILVVDDLESNVAFLVMTLQAAGFHNIVTADSGLQAIDECLNSPPDLVMLDLHMPEVDGFKVLEAIRPAREDFFPILVFTADTTMDARRRALNLGASDFLTKPGDVLEIGLRVRNFLQMRHMYKVIADQRNSLEIKVQERTHALQEAHVEILARLALAAEYRDDATGEHTKRVSNLSGKLARAAGLTEEECRLIQFGSLLHDIGKIGIPDSILLKRGPLQPDEFEQMKEHAVIGGRLLANSKSPLLQKAKEIALSHHERWDGTGYPSRLAGEAIPISGRIVAISDVYDALISERVYKSAMSVPEAIAEIVRGAGTHFDPKLVQAFFSLVSGQMEDQALSKAA